MRLILLFALVLCFNAYGQTQILWDEAVQGDIVDNFPTPAAIPALVEGTNYLAGEVELHPFAENAYVGDSDYFAITIPEGFYLQSINLNSDGLLYIGFGDPVYTETDVEWTHLLLSPANGDLLTQMGLSPLPAGSYGMYIMNNDTANAPTTAHYNLTMAAVPEPSTLVLVAGAIVGISVRGFRVFRPRA